MHIIYIEFGISKSSQYKKVCNLAKQLPNYNYSEDVTQCFVDDIIDYVRIQDIVLTLIDKIHKWKNAKVLFYEKPYKAACDYKWIRNMVQYDIDISGEFFIEPKR